MRRLPQLTLVCWLVADLTYPMAWGNSPLTDFAAWRTAARQRVLEFFRKHL